MKNRILTIICMLCLVAGLFTSNSVNAATPLPCNMGPPDAAYKKCAISSVQPKKYGNSMVIGQTAIQRVGKGKYVVWFGLQCVERDDPNQSSPKACEVLRFDKAKVRVNGRLVKTYKGKVTNTDIYVVALPDMPGSGKSFRCVHGSISARAHISVRWDVPRNPYGYAVAGQTPLVTRPCK